MTTNRARSNSARNAVYLNILMAIETIKMTRHCDSLEYHVLQEIFFSLKIANVIFLQEFMGKKPPN